MDRRGFLNFAVTPFAAGVLSALTPHSLWAHSSQYVWPVVEPRADAERLQLRLGVFLVGLCKDRLPELMSGVEALRQQMSQDRNPVELPPVRITDDLGLELCEIEIRVYGTVVWKADKGADKQLEELEFNPTFTGVLADLAKVSYVYFGSASDRTPRISES